MAPAGSGTGGAVRKVRVKRTYEVVDLISALQVTAVLFQKGVPFDPLKCRFDCMQSLHF